MTMQTKTSIVIPTYNEEENIKDLILRINKSLTVFHINYELIFIDDNSSDNTVKEIEKFIEKKYPIKIFLKQDKKGKAFSLLEGFQKADGEIIAMIDADLQYPPESIPEMVKKLDEFDIVVANRETRQVSITRKYLSKIYSFIFGKILFGLSVDVQSGLKVFKKQILNNLHLNPTKWGFDYEFLYKAKRMGRQIGQVNIFFDERIYGISKINYILTGLELAYGAIKLRLEYLLKDISLYFFKKIFIVPSINQNKKKVLIKLSHFLIPSIIFLSVFFILLSLVGSYPFGHDESVYLTKARSWIEGTPADQYVIYRPIGMVVSGWIFLQFGNSEQIVRTFGVIFGAVTTIFIYLFFKRIFNTWIAISVVGVVVASSLFLREAPQFFNDIPSSGFLIGILWLLYIHYETAGRSKSIYFAAPLSALAFYIRYGVASALGVIGALSALILAPKFIKKEDVNNLKLKKTLIIGILLFVPHFLESYILMKNPLGILTLSGKAAGRKYLGEGLASYVKWLPSEIGGWVLGTTAIIGILATIIIISRKNWRENYVNLLWIGSIGLLTFIVTGLLVHAEARYVFFSMVLLSGVGITSTYYLARIWSKIFANLLMIIFLLVAFYFGTIHYQNVDSFFRERESNKINMAYVEALNIIRKDSYNENGCALWLTPFRPTASWYSKCSILTISDIATFEKDIRIHLNKNLYSLVFTKLKEPQVTQNESEKYGIILVEIFRANKLSYGDLVVYRMMRNNSEEEDYLKLLEK